MGRMLKKLGLAVAGVILMLCFGAGILSARQDVSAGSEEETVTLKEVVVTAAKLQGYLEEHPQQVEVMTGARIQENGYSDLNQVLNALPGVEVKPSGTGLGSRISIRGSGGGGKILILINGRPMSGSQYGVVNLDGIALDTVARVDVFKPPVPVWLGPGATAGAINIVLADQTDESSSEKKSTRVGASFGSFGKAGVSASDRMSPGDHHLTLSASGNHKDGKRENSDRDSGSLTFQWDLPSGDGAALDVSGRYYQSEHGCSGPTHNPTPDARQSYRKGGLDLRMEAPLAGSAGLDLKTYLDVTRLKDRSQSGMVSTLNALTLGTKGETDWRTEDNTWSFLLSGILAEDRIDHTLSGDHHRTHVSLGLQGDRTFDALVTTLGARCDYTSDFRFQPAADGGVSIPLGDRSRIKLNAGYGVNVPTFSQLYQPSHGAIDQVRGNPDLQEERIWTASAGTSFRFSETRTLEITAFHEDTDDKIAYQEGTDGIKRPVNIDGAWRRGVEAAATWAMTSWLDLDLSHVWQKTRNRQTGTELTYAPNHKFKASVTTTLPTRTRLETTVTSVSGFFSDLENTADKKVDGYTAVNFKILQPVSFQACKAELSILFENLLDEAYEFHYGYPDDGFRLTAGITLDF